MGFFSEIYLNDNHISTDNWQELIQKVAKYNGRFNSFKIIVVNNHNQLRFYLYTKCNLPPTINGLDSFLLKNTDNIFIPKTRKTKYFLPKLEHNIIDIINYLEIKDKGTLKYLEITITKHFKDYYQSKINMYLEKNHNLIKYKIIFALVPTLLSIDFSNNKRYFYKSTPKYLNIDKLLDILQDKTSSSLLKVDTFPYLQGDYYIDQNSFDFNKHSIVFGSSGCGKSKFISSLINNINEDAYLKEQYKVIVIDPHAALEDDIGEFAKTIDFKDPLSSIDLFINNNEDYITSTELLLDLFKSLISDQYNSKLERVLRHTIHVLLAKKLFNFSNLRKILLDIEFRNDLIQDQNNRLPISVIEFFLTDFNELKTKSYGEAISPIIGFIDEMEMIPVFNDQKSNINLSDTINDNFLTLFSLNRTKLGNKVTKTISGLIMQQLLTLIQSSKIEEHIIFIIDEVAVVENPILCRFLSEARKYNLSLILAGQYFNQIDNSLKDAIFANVINYYIFRVSKLDANILVDNFNMNIPLDDSKERKIKLLTELNNRECLVRISSKDKLLPAFKASTISYTSRPKTSAKTSARTKVINKKERTKPSIKNPSTFSLNTNISLKDILLNNSKGRRIENE